MKRGGSLKRDKQLKRSGSLARKTRLHARGGRRFKGTEDLAYLNEIRSLHCLVSVAGSCWGKIIAHHDPTKANGGKDRGGTVPLCWQHHEEVHRIGRKTFDAKYGCNLRGEAVRLNND